MPLPVKRCSVLAFVFACLALTSSIAIAAAEWQVIKISGHDYLSVDNISKFYGLPAEVVPSGAKIQTDTADHPLEFVSGSREAIINGARSWLCFPVIEHDGKSLVSRTDVAKTIEPLVRPHRVPDVGKVQTVVLDPGHGGHDKGQMSRYGAEKDFALDVARKLRPILQAKGLRVIMTREGDYFVPLEVRAKIANAARNSIFVSIHFNATNDDPNATGFEIFSFTPRGAPSTSDGNVAASSVQHAARQFGGCAKYGALRVHLSFASRSPPRVRPWYQTRTVRGAAPDEGAGGADRRRVFDGARRKQIDFEQRLARETGWRDWDRDRKLSGTAGQESSRQHSLPIIVAKRNRRPSRRSRKAV